MMKWRCPAATLLLVVVTAIPALAQRGAGRPQVTPPEGPVWQVIRKNCTGCHGIDDYAFHALDRAGWQTLLETKHKGRKVAVAGKVVNNSRFAAHRWRVILVTMRERGAVLTDEELERMVEWLGRGKGNQSESVSLVADC